MWGLFDFIREKKHWLLLIVLEVFSLKLFFGDGYYRQGLVAYISTWFSSHVNEEVSYWYSFIGLREENQTLLREHARLQQELNQLKHRLESMETYNLTPARSLTANPADTSHVSSEYTIARIINMRNMSGAPYYIINKGSRDGLRRDMPVVSSSGVVGAIMEVSESYSIVIPITNPHLKLSCAIKDRGDKGELYSEGYGLSAYFGGIPLHTKVSPGDTIVTSGHSYIFPEGLMVGVVKRHSGSNSFGHSKAFASYEIELSTDFMHLSYVYVLQAMDYREAHEVERFISNKDE